MDKAYENRLRRMADRRGFLLRKSRRRDPHALDYGYQLVDADTEAVVACDQLTGRGFGLTLEEVEQWLTDNQGRARAIMPPEEKEGT